jgi:hypothetical protein
VYWTCDESSLLGFYYGAIFNDIRMRSPNYNAVAGTDESPNWEPVSGEGAHSFRACAWRVISAGPNLTLFCCDWFASRFCRQYPSSADGLEFSPITLMKEYMKDWGDTKPISMMEGNSQPQIITSLLVMTCKLFYLAGTDDPVLMQQASLSMSIPSISGLIQFDQYGRIAQNDQFVVQYGADGIEYHLITPLDVGEPDVYPMPTWAERIPPHEGSASFAGTANEKAVMAVTTSVNLYLLALLIGVVVKRHSAIIKSSSPVFCAIALIGGMVCISSNYGNSFFAVKEGCGANAWLLTTGFTMMFSSLFAKTWRIWKIFQSGKLQVVKITNADLYAIVGVLVGIDVLINCIWSGVSGFPVQYVVVDRYRPVNDYVQCEYSDASLNFVYFHLAYKALVIVCGIGLAIAARNVPAMFNETPYIATSMYNCTLLLAFVIPIVGAQVGGRTTTYLVRSYGLLVIVASTASILFVPKFLMLSQRADLDTHTKTAAGTIAQTAASISPAEENLTQPPVTSKDQMIAPIGRKNSDKVISSSAPYIADGDKYRVHSPTSPDQMRSDEDVMRQLRSQLLESQAEIATLRQRLNAAPSGDEIIRLPGATQDDTAADDSPSRDAHAINME